MGELDDLPDPLPADFNRGVNYDAFATDIAAARQGCDKALNRLFAACRSYLLVVAKKVMPAEIQAKTGPSDIVQETLLQVNKHFDRFRGTSERELLAWLRGVLLNNVHDVTRRFLGTEMRQVRREVSLDQGLSSGDQDRLVDVVVGGPGSQLVADEDAARLSAALGRLPKDYRQVILLHNWDGRSFEQIGEELGRSQGAARKLWARAVDRMRVELLAEPGSRGDSWDG